MIRSNTHPRSRWALFAGRLAILALPAALVVGCGDGGSDKPAPTATSVPASTSTATQPPATSTPTQAAPTATPTTAANADASAACEKLAGCDQCLANFTGRCLRTADCAPRLSADVAICINGVTGCNQSALGDCLFLGCDGNDPSGECQ